MKKIQKEKGITLIALVITIIVLLILAGVAISMLSGENGILQQAANAKQEYGSAQEDEVGVLDDYLQKIEGITQGGGTSIVWTDNGDGTLTSSNNVTVEIGDYVDYDEGNYTHTPEVAKGAGTSDSDESSSTTGVVLETSELETEDLSWRVLGVNSKGELELISADPTTQNLYLANDEAYLNAEANLNKFCNDLYGKGIYATGARSLNVEDINKLTHYEPTTYTEYGQKWIYRYPTEEQMGSTTRNMQYSKDGGKTWENITDSNFQTFRLPNETVTLSSTNSGSREETYTHYDYNIADELTTADGYTSDKATEIVNMITRGDACWLASNCVKLMEFAYYHIRIVGYGWVDVGGGCYTSYGDQYQDYYKVRPVVSLKSNVLVTTNDSENSPTNMWTLSSANN